MKKKILIFIVFISAFLCFGMSAKADMVCSYILSNDLKDKLPIYEPGGSYSLFYNYLYNRKFELDGTSTNYQNLLDISNTLSKYVIGDNPFDMYEIKYKIGINNLSSVSYKLHMTSANNKNYDYDHNWPNYAKYTFKKDSCPDLIFVQYEKYCYSYGISERCAPFFRIKNDVYFDDYSDIYSDMELPRDIENGGYLIGISENTGFKSNYYDNLICVLKGAFFGTSSNLPNIEEKLKELSNRGFNYQNLDDKLIDSTIVEDGQNLLTSDSYNILKPLFLNFNNNEIKNYKDFFNNNIFLDDMNQCFGSTDLSDSSKAMNWLRQYDKNNPMRYAILLKLIFDEINVNDLDAYRKAYSNDKLESDSLEWVGCQYNCQLADDEQQETCYNSCNEDHPYGACDNEKDPQYKSCINECKNGDNSCIQNCELIKAVCSINCDNLVSNHANIAEEKLYDEIASSNTCSNLSSDEELECIKLTCKEKMSDDKYLNDHSNSIVNDYNDMKNGTTAAQQTMDHLLNSIKDSMIEHGGIEIDDNDICNILEDIKSYKRTALLIIAIGGPILVIILTGYDAITMIASSKDEDNKKFFSRLKIRLILIVILILVPIIIDWLLKIFEIHSCN